MVDLWVFGRGALDWGKGGVLVHFTHYGIHGGMGRGRIESRSIDRNEITLRNRIRYEKLCGMAEVTDRR